MNFKLMGDYEPRGDQPEAIDQLSRGIEAGEKLRAHGEQNRLTVATTHL